jgi:hypothetical protein
MSPFFSTAGSAGAASSAPSCGSGATDLRVRFGGRSTATTAGSPSAALLWVLGVARGAVFFPAVRFALRGAAAAAGVAAGLRT